MPAARIPAAGATSNDGIWAIRIIPPKSANERKSQAIERSWYAHGCVGIDAFTARSTAASGMATQSMIPTRRTPATVPER